LKTLFPSKALLLSALLVLSMAVLAQISVRPGIILLLLSDSILSSKAESAGQAVTARLVQNIPLAEGSTSKPGNTIVGRTIELNATADAAGATTAYRIDKFTAYKKHSLIPICSRSVHSSKNSVAVQASQSRQGDYTPQDCDHRRNRARLRGRHGTSTPQVSRLSPLLPDAIVERDWRTIGEPTSLT
jgi:hypothetical protein